jgi:hypothetical protein
MKKTAVNEYNYPWYCRTFDMYFETIDRCKESMGKGECRKCENGPEAVEGTKDQLPDLSPVSKKEAESIIMKDKKDSFVEPELKHNQKTRKYLDPNTKTWIIKYRDADGNILKHDTETDDRALALSIQQKRLYGLKPNEQPVCGGCGGCRSIYSVGLCRDCFEDKEGKEDQKPKSTEKVKPEILPIEREGYQNKIIELQDDLSMLSGKCNEHLKELTAHEKTIKELKSDISLRDQTIEKLQNGQFIQIVGETIKHSQDQLLIDFSKYPGDIFRKLEEMAHDDFRGLEGMIMFLIFNAYEEFEFIEEKSK